MGGLGFWELIAILLVVLLFFGGNKLPDIGRGLGKAIKDFRNSLSESGRTQDNSPEDKKDPPR